MELIGITRNGVDQFVASCQKHGYFYNGRPPIVTGCVDCWEAYYFGNTARSKDIKESVDQLECAVRHAAELEDKGLWDFTPTYDFKIDKEN